MFKSALFKLTGLYLLILMFVSLLFSINLYRISSYEVSNRLRRQVDFLNARPSRSLGFDMNPFEQARLEELSSSQRHIFMELLYANIVILVAGGAGSYFLAKRTIKPIEAAHAAQVRFTADASHELRTPLAAMRTETEVALRDPKLTIKQARQQLESNVEELQRLSALSDGLLQLARGIETSDLHQKITPSKLVSEAVKQVAFSAQAKQIHLDKQLMPKVVLYGNEAQLVQLLVILLDNAIKYSPEEQKVIINAKQIHGQLKLSVTDFGAGISATDMPHIFERFYRADTSRTSDTASGYGLGLAIGKQIVDAHNGTIEVDSTTDKGTVFTISLPISKR